MLTYIDVQEHSLAVQNNLIEGYVLLNDGSLYAQWHISFHQVESQNFCMARVYMYKNMHFVLKRIVTYNHDYSSSEKF
jgi:hypothetical protein